MNKATLKGLDDTADSSAPIEISELSARVDILLAERKQKVKWLYTAVGMSKAGWVQMWQHGSVKLSVVYRIAQALDVSMSSLLGLKEPDATAASVRETPSAYGTRRPYLEERIEALEREMRTLKQQLKK